MSIHHQTGKELAEKKANTVLAPDLPEITPALIQHHIAVGEQLRAETMRRLMRSGTRKIKRFLLRVVRTVARGTFNPASRPLGDQKPLS
jgi:hypothetical protein